MKRLLILVLALSLLTLPAFSADLGLEETDQTLCEKLRKQVLIGSGLRGQLTFEMAGDTYLSSLIGEGLADALVGFTFLPADGSPENWQAGIHIQTDGKPAYDVRLDREDGRVMVSGTPDTEPFLFREDAFISSLFPRAAGTLEIPWEPMLLGLFTSGNAVWNNDITAALDPYSVLLELWMARYAQYDMQLSEGKMIAVYTIPVTDMIEQLKALLTGLIADSAARAVLGRMLAPEDEQAYFNEAALAFYLLALDDMEADGQIQITQTISTRGESGALSLTLPFFRNAYGIQSVSLSFNQEGSFSLSFVSADGEWALSAAPAGENQTDGTIRFTPPPLENPGGSHASLSASAPFSAAFTLLITHEERTDEDFVRHTESVYRLHMAPDDGPVGAEGAQERKLPEAEYDGFIPFDTELTVHLRSGTAKTSPITIQAELTQIQQDARFGAHLEAKTAAPWPCEPCSWDKAEFLAGPPAKEKLLDLLLTLLTRFTPAMKDADKENR